MPSDSRRSPPRVASTPAGPSGLGGDEVLVLEPEHLPAPHREMATPGEALGIEPGRPVEGLRHGSAPVHHQRLVVRAGHGEAADVERLAQGPVGGSVPRLGHAVDAAEVESLIPDVELIEPGEARPHDDVALGARLERATTAEIQDPLEHLAGFASHELESVVGPVEELLLILQIRMFGHLSPFAPVPRGNGPV
jgi:hypothetical protein